MKNICGILVGVVLFCGCSGSSFTDNEVKIIKKGEGVMPLWTTANEQESVFLRQKAKPLKSVDVVSVVYQKLRSRMLATVTDTTNPGVGIAAPQVGVSSRIIAVQRFDKEGEPFEFYINPEIIHYSETKVCGVEGCLSVPEALDSIWRADEIVVRYTPEPEVTINGNKIKAEWCMNSQTDTIRGFTAVIFQHEIDHLDGILFTDRVEKKK